LIGHAYFKAIIFIGAGAIIHRVGGYQDIRKMGSLVKNNFFISGVFLSGSLRLCGIPFLTGFYSKDAILEQFFIASYGAWTVRLCYLATIITAAYSLRVILILFTSFSSRESVRGERDSRSRISVGIFALYFPAVSGGLGLRC
jgi:NADH:ubiquinone oxidoreductase subunit 5 (subunit L)/multisubunit Na+/H+ antiporter MnhA subunit